MRLVLPAVLALIPAALLSAQRGDRRAASPELANFEFREVEFDSKNLIDGSGHCGVYLPKGFDEAVAQGRKFPLVVWLHGFGGYQEFRSRGGATKLDELRGTGAIPEIVFATFQAPGGRRGRSVYVNGEAAGKVEDAIVQDLVGYAIAKLGVAPERDRHAIMGISIGGYGALKIALHHPEVFGAVAAHSSAIFADDPTALPPQYERQIGRAMQLGLATVFGDPIDKDKWAAEMPMGIVRKASKGAFEGLAVYFDAGTEDHYGFAQPNSELDRLMTEKAIDHTFRLVEGGGHAWSSDSMLDNLAQSLQFVGRSVGDKVAAKAADATTPAGKGND